MSDDLIVDQIEGLGDRRLLGCAVGSALLIAAGCVAFGLVVRHSEDAPTRAAAALAVSGVLFGFATSSLAAKIRKLLTAALVLAPLAASAYMFFLRTTLGRSHDVPLRLAAAPVCLTIGYLLGHFIRPAHLRLKDGN